jgi:hypothetical protein
MIDRHLKQSRYRAPRRIDVSASARHAALIITAQELQGASTHWEWNVPISYGCKAGVALNAKQFDFDE